MMTMNAKDVQHRIIFLVLVSLIMCICVNITVYISKTQLLIPLGISQTDTGFYIGILEMNHNIGFDTSAVGILNHLTNSQITLAVVLAYMTLQLSQFIFLYKKN